MKTINQITKLTAGLSFMILLSCSKVRMEHVSINIPHKSDSTQLQNFRPRPPVSTGSITGTFFPIPEKAIITAFNANYVSRDIIADQNGNFTINNLPVGTYNLKIIYVLYGASDYARIFISRIIVNNNVITDLGIIYL